MKLLAKILLGVNLIAFVHLLRGKPKLFLEACRKAFAVSLHSPTGIPEIALDNILADRKPVIRMSVMRYEDGTLPYQDALALLSILVAEAPNEVLEIGTYMGHTTRQMAENLETTTIHTVDLPEDFQQSSDPEQGIPKDDFHLIARRLVGREFREQPCSNRIKQHFADTAKWDFRQAGHPTFFFIDGSHTYEYCKNDSEKCLAACGGRGVFLWHDCDLTHDGVTRFLSEWRRQGRDIRRIAGTAVAYWKNV